MESRYKDYERDQQYFITLDAEEIRKNNSIVAAIDDYVENHVGIELFEGNTNNILDLIVSFRLLAFTFVEMQKLF
jgi:hypothetical protein